MHYFKDLKRYMRFGEVDERALRKLHPSAAPHFKAIAHDFYERLRSHPEAMAVFRSEEQVLRLQATLGRWMDLLLMGPWDDVYFEKRCRIGKVHVQIQMPQHHMFSAMALVQEHLMSLAWEHMDSEDAKTAVAALQKVTNIDLAIMLDSYRDHFVDKVQGYEREERASLESRLEQSQALYHSIFESSGAAIIITDKSRHVKLFNSMAERLTGYSRKEASGQIIDDLIVHPLDASKMQNLLTRSHGDLVPTPHVMRVVTSKKSDRWVRWHCSPIEETSDLCLIGVDITNERKLEKQTQRVQTLAALGTLAAGLAHEIRNPLNAAQLQLLLVDRAITKAGDAVNKRAMASSGLVKAELARLAGLVEDFLAFARPTELRITNADLSGLCDQITTLLHGDAEGAGTELESFIEGDVFARVDLERLKQVLINLLRNAIDAAGEGGRVELHCRRVSQSVLFDVIDDGPGVPEGIDIFEPFTTSKDAGTGLGLSIVHRIVSDHEGMIEVSRDGAKTTFTVELPVDGPGSQS